MKAAALSMIVGVVGCLAGLPAAAEQGFGQQRASIEYRVPQGFQYGFQQLFLLDSSLNLSGGGQTMGVQQQVQTRVEGNAQVLSVQNGKPSQVRLSFGPGSGTQITMNGQQAPQPFPLAGREVVVTVQNESVVQIEAVGGGALPMDPATVSVISPVVAFEDALRPGRPVGVGDEWPAQINDPSGMGQTNMTIRVVGFQQLGDRRAMQLQAQGTMTNTADGMSMNGPLSATMLVDLETGLPLQMNGTASVEISGASFQQGQQIQINGSGQLSSQLAIAPGGMAAGPSQGPVGGPQQTPRGPAPGAIDTRNNDPRLVGVFKGEAIAGGGKHAAYVNTQLWWVFRRDGIVYFGAQSFFTATKRDYNQEIEWTAHGNSAGKIDQGRWRTDGRILSIQWDDGRSLRVAYSFEPDGSLVFRNANTGKLINFYPRVH